MLCHRKNDAVLSATGETVPYTARQRILWDKIIAVLKKWGIPYVDLSTDTNLSAWNKTLADKYFKYDERFLQGDGTHPLKNTYEEFYLPLIESKLKSL